MDIVDTFLKNFIDFNVIFDSFLEGVVIASPSRKFLYWNQAAKQILNDVPENVDSTEWAFRYGLYDLETQDYLAYEKLPMVKALNGEEFTDYRIMTKNAINPEGIILSVSGKPLRSGAATIGGLTTFRDITAQVKQEKSLESEKKFYERILDLMPGIVFIKDLEGKFLYGNKSFHTLLGSNSVLGKTSNDFLQRSMADKVYSHDQIVIRSGKAQDFEEIIYWKDGRSSTFQTTRFPYVESGQLKGVCAVAKDITEEIETNAALVQERNRSAQISKLAAIGVLSAEIAHEIKNPLTILNTTSDVIQYAIGEKDIDLNLLKEKVNVIKDTIVRMDKTASSLSKLSRDSSLEKDSSFFIREILDDVTSICSFKTRKLKMEVQVKESDCLDLKMTTNRVQISEVILNLVMNALDAVEELAKPEVSIEVKKIEKDVCFMIWDNGPGVPEEIRERIFEPFFTTKQNQQGTGLGLSISKKIVEKYNGRLEYREMNGSHCFVLSLPIE